MGKLGSAIVSKVFSSITTPGSGERALYPKSDGWYDKDSSGVETKLAAAAGEVPAGSIFAFTGASAPTGYLLADGAAVSRSTYATLFALFGTTYGAGDGSTTFNMPNLKGRIPVGIDSGQTEFDTRGETGGAKTHTLTSGEMPAHTHGPGSGSFFVTYNSPSGSALTWAAGTGVSTPSTTGSTGGGGAHNNLQPYMALHYIIKT